MEPVASPTFPDLISVRVLLLSFLTHRLCVAACSMISYELVRSRYVKLTKDQDAPLEEIRPGELNQPVQSVFDVLFWGSAGVPSAGNLCLRAMNHLLMNVELLELVCIITIAELSMSALYGPLLHSWVFHLSGALGNERTPRCSDLGISVNEDLPLVQVFISSSINLGSTLQQNSGMEFSL
ncbi:hypothetical protein MUK42_27777 [Musa troglodytarum]|uniref:Uncharacterized protein n=1 Tax=Musa troglodytarum TaxID=320322 RepID=A0A9E7F899_9LILI|nr:hypothetical protein MUK42_27777 [Musa troglodytarum]